MRLLIFFWPNIDTVKAGVPLKRNIPALDILTQQRLNEVFFIYFVHAQLRGPVTGISS